MGASCSCSKEAKAPPRQKPTDKIAENGPPPDTAAKEECAALAAAARSEPPREEDGEGQDEQREQQQQQQQQGEGEKEDEEEEEQEEEGERSAAPPTEGGSDCPQEQQQQQQQQQEQQEQQHQQQQQQQQERQQQQQEEAGRSEPSEPARRGSGCGRGMYAGSAGGESFCSRGGATTVASAADYEEYARLPQAHRLRFTTIRFVFTHTRGCLTRTAAGIHLSLIRIWKPSGEEKLFDPSTCSVAARNAPGRNPKSAPPTNLFDGRRDTKWAAAAKTTMLDVEFEYPVEIGGYSFVSAWDHPEWDPTAWILVGLDGSSGWKLLDNREAVVPPGRSKEYSFRVLQKGSRPRCGSLAPVENDTAYSSVRIKFTNVQGGLSATDVCLSRIRLFTTKGAEIDLSRAKAGDDTPGTPRDVFHAIDNNPSTSWTCCLALAEVVIDLEVPVPITAYAFTTAQGGPEKDPTSWLVSGRTDASDDWVELDQRKRIAPPRERCADYQKFRLGAVR